MSNPRTLRAPGGFLCIFKGVMQLPKQGWGFMGLQRVVCCLYSLLLLKQSRHFRLLVSRGAKGSEVIAAPQLAHSQWPENLGRSVEIGTVSIPKSSTGAGSLASSA